MEVIFYLLIGLFFFALVGHGIWVAVRTVILGLIRLGQTSRLQAIPAEICPRCGEAWDKRVGVGSCLVCGWSPYGVRVSAGADSTQAVAALRERVRRYTQLGLMAEETSTQLLAALSARPGPSAARPLSDVRPAPFVDLTPGPKFEPPEVPKRAEITYAEIHPLDRPDPPAVVPAIEPGPPKPGWLAALTAGFLEQTNIRWGEVVGGLLVVGCSLALVISFWADIAERPFLKYGLFNGVTALLYVVGIQAEKRWSLPTTARALFVIATLLVPLNFLAVASFSKGTAPGSSLAMAGEVAAALVFAWLTYRAGQLLVSKAPQALAAGVVVPSLAMLLTRRWVGPGSVAAVLLAFGALPLLAQGGAVGWFLGRSRRDAAVGLTTAQELLGLLGLTSFTAALGVGLVVAQGGHGLATGHTLAPLAPVASASVMAAGLWLWRRTIAAELVGFRTAGASLAAAGVLILLSGVALAWPDPSGMLPVALLGFAVLTAVAFGFETPAAHVPAGACLLLAYLLGWHLATGRLAWSGGTPAGSAAALASDQSGAALVPFALVALGAAGATLRKGRRFDAQALALVGVLAAFVSLSLVTWPGFRLGGDPTRLAWVYAVYAVAALFAAGWSGRYPLVEGTSGKVETEVLAWAGSGLALAALARGLIPGVGGLPWATAFLAHATLAAAGASRKASRLWGGDRVGSVLGLSALVTSVAAAAFIAFATPWAVSAVVATRLLWLAVVWLALAWRGVTPALFAASQGALAGSVVFGVAAVLGRRAWYAAAPAPWLDPWSLEAQALALDAFCLAWIGVRLGVRSWTHEAATTAKVLLDTPWPALDRVVRGVVVVGLVGLAVYGVFPGLAQELTPRGIAAGNGGGAGRVVPPLGLFEIESLPHRHALGLGAWAALGATLAVFAAGRREAFRTADRLGAFLVAATAVPLAAGRWESSVAAASALRWAGAAFVLAASAAVWERERLAVWGRKLGWPDPPARDDRRDVWGTGLALAAAIPVVVLTVFAVASTLAGDPVVGPEPGTLFARIGAACSYAPPLVLIAAAVVGFAARDGSPGFAFAGGIGLVVAATLGGLARVGSPGVAFDAAFCTGLVQVDSVVASLFAVIWMFALFRRPVPGEGVGDGLLAGTVGLGAALAVLPVVVGTWLLFFDPMPGPEHRAVAGFLGWAAAGLATASALALLRRLGGTARFERLALGVPALAAFLATGLAFRDKGDWLTYHGMIASLCLAGGALPVAVWQACGRRLESVRDDLKRGVVLGSTVCLALVVLFATRAYWSDPYSPWWTVGGLVVASATAAVLARFSGWGGYLAVAGSLLNVAVTGWWLRTPSRWSPIDLLNVNIVALALPVPSWLWIDRRLPRPQRVGGGGFPGFASWAALGGLALGWL